MALGTVVVERFLVYQFDIARSRDKNVTWHYEWDTLMFSRHPAKFGDHRDCDSGDIMFLVAEEQDLTC